MEKVSVAELVDSGICPTCYDKEHGGCVFGDNESRTIYANDKFSCILIDNPRAVGHAIITSNDHYKDMMDIPDDLCTEVFVFAKKAMNAIKAIYGAESVYLCTMCDGPMNHFHVQLIPRYDFEKRGSKNFVKERMVYVEDKEKLQMLKDLLKD